MNWWDVVNPFHYLGEAAGKVAADAWTAAMLGIWNAGLWLLKLMFTLEDAFLTPDLSATGPAAGVYPYTVWLAGALVLVMLAVQFGLAVFRRDGQGLARAVIGVGQYGMVLTVWVAVAVAVLAGAGGITAALTQALLGVDVMSAWAPWAGFSTEDISDGTVATVLGFMGLFVVFGAIGHGLVMLARAGSLVVLTATAPIAAAGLVSETGRGWFWKTLRWFLAASFSPTLMILVLGIGVKLTQGVALGMTDTVQAAIGTAVPGALLIAIGAFAPLALFKLLAFVDPGTSSGAALRAGLSAQGGLQGLLRGDTGAPASSAASTADGYGRSQGESASEADTSARFTRHAGGAMAGVLGVAGQGLVAGLGAMQTLAGKGAALGADVTHQMGVGHASYVPDFSTSRTRGAGSRGPRDDDNPDINGSGPADSTPDDAMAGAAPRFGPALGAPGAGGRPGGPPGASATTSGATGATGAAGAAAGGEAAAAIPVVPV